MQLSKFTVFVDHYPDFGNHLAFNTRTHALIKIDQSLRNVLEILRTHHNVFELQAFSSYEDQFKSLMSMGILCEDEADDVQKLEGFMHARKRGTDRKSYRVTILTTYDCNLACVYCFEESTRTTKQVMLPATADKVIFWLKSKIESQNFAELTIVYYGGEPLLNQSIIHYISGRMKPWCDEREVKLKMFLQSNGVLLTSKVVDELKPLGLYGARISLDGLPEIHDKQRPTRGGGTGSFARILKNIKDIVGKIEITTATGYMDGNPQNVLDLLDYFDDEGILPKLNGFLYSPIHPALGPKGKTHEVQSPQCMNHYKTETLLPATKIIKDYMTKKGFRVGSGLMTSMCPLSREHSAPTIDTEGYLYKCNSMLGHPELSIGHVDQVEYNEKHKEFMAMEPWRKCDSSCPYKPLCADSCKLMAFFSTRNFSAKNCERSYMDAFIPEAIKAEYNLRQAAKTKVPEPVPVAS